MNENLQSQRNDKLSPYASCENCIHSIRKKIRQDMVVCVQFLQLMPTNRSSVCDLYLLKSKES
jgi:hypothetical protein